MTGAPPRAYGGEPHHRELTPIGRCRASPAATAHRASHAPVAAKLLHHRPALLDGPPRARTRRDATKEAGGTDDQFDRSGADWHHYFPDRRGACRAASRAGRCSALVTGRARVPSRSRMRPAGLGRTELRRACSCSVPTQASPGIGVLPLTALFARIPGRRRSAQDVVNRCRKLPGVRRSTVGIADDLGRRHQLCIRKRSFLIVTLTTTENVTHVLCAAAGLSGSRAVERCGQGRQGRCGCSLEGWRLLLEPGSRSRRYH
jgi:hypothetical protein